MKCPGEGSYPCECGWSETIMEISRKMASLESGERHRSPDEAHLSPQYRSLKRLHRALSDKECDRSSVYRTKLSRVVS